MYKHGRILSYIVILDLPALIIFPVLCLVTKLNTNSLHRICLFNKNAVFVFNNCFILDIIFNFMAIFYTFSVVKV